MTAILLAIATATTVPTLHLNTSVVPFTTGYALNGTVAPPSTGYEVGLTVLHIDISGNLLDLSANVLAAVSASDVSLGAALGIGDPQIYGAGFTAGLVARSFAFGQGLTWGHFQPPGDLRLVFALKLDAPRWHVMSGAGLVH